MGARQGKSKEVTAFLLEVFAGALLIPLRMKHAFLINAAVGVGDFFELYLGLPRLL